MVVKTGLFPLDEKKTVDNRDVDLQDAAKNTMDGVC